MFESVLIHPGSDFESAHGLAEITKDRTDIKIGPNIPYRVSIDTERRFVMYEIWHGSPFGDDEYEVRYGLNLAGSTVVAHCTAALEFPGAPSAWRFINNGLYIPDEVGHPRDFIIATLIEALEAERRALGVTRFLPFAFK